MYLRKDEQDPGAFIERVMMKFWTKLFFGRYMEFGECLDSLDEYYELARGYHLYREREEDFREFFPFFDDSKYEELPQDLIGFIKNWPSFKKKYISVFEMVNMSEREIKRWFISKTGGPSAFKVMRDFFGTKEFNWAIDLTNSEESFLELIISGVKDLGYGSKSDRFTQLMDKAIEELHRLGLSDKYRKDLH